MEVSVVEAAERLGVSARRVRERIQAGDLQARRVGRVWVLDEAQLARSARSSRPMSERVSWAFMDLLAGGQGEGVSQPEQSRLRRKAAQLINAGDEAPALMRSWLHRRAVVVWFSVAPADLGDLKADHRLVLSGVSDPRSGVSAVNLVEAYVSEDDVPELEFEYLLSQKGNHNVLLHVIRGRSVASPLPLPVLIADLADHDGPREDAAVVALLQEVL